MITFGDTSGGLTADGETSVVAVGETPSGFIVGRDPGERGPRVATPPGGFAGDIFRRLGGKLRGAGVI